jgi:hypothetical protein
MSLKDLMTRVIDAVAHATGANATERLELEQAFVRDPEAFIDEWGEYIPAELLHLLRPTERPEG